MRPETRHAALPGMRHSHDALADDVLVGPVTPAFHVPDHERNFVAQGRVLLEHSERGERARPASSGRHAEERELRLYTGMEVAPLWWPVVNTRMERLAV